MEGVKRYFYIALGFIGVMLAGTTAVCILLQLKMEVSLPLILFCAVSWLLFILAVYKTLEADYESDTTETERTCRNASDSGIEPKNQEMPRI
jgi:hypothetical protein